MEGPIPVRLKTGASTNLTFLGRDMNDLFGITAVNTAAYAIFIKAYWFTPGAGSADAPTVGTTVPNATWQVGATSGIDLDFGNARTKSNGDLWIAVTKLAADSDTTAVASGDGLITFWIG